MTCVVQPNLSTWELSSFTSHWCSCTETLNIFQTSHTLFVSVLLSECRSHPQSSSLQVPPLFFLPLVSKWLPCRFSDSPKLVNWLHTPLVSIILFAHNCNTVLRVVAAVSTLLSHFEGNRHFLFISVASEEARKHTYIFFSSGKEVLKQNLVKMIKGNLNNIFIFSRGNSKIQFNSGSITCVGTW